MKNRKNPECIGRIKEYFGLNFKPQIMSTTSFIFPLVSDDFSLINLDDQTIDFALAKALHQGYLTNDVHRIELPGSTANNLKCWKGYRLHTDSLLKILKIDPDTIETDVQALFVFFAIHPEDRNADGSAKLPQKKDERITMIFAPIIEDPLDVKGQIDEKGTIYEYVDPCPDKCPSNLR
jgi:hypothetical protein